MALGFNYLIGSPCGRPSLVFATRRRRDRRREPGRGQARKNAFGQGDHLSELSGLSAALLSGPCRHPDDPVRRGLAGLGDDHRRLHSGHGAQADHT